MTIQCGQGYRLVLPLIFSFLLLFSNVSIASKDRRITITENGATLIYGISLVKDTLLLYEPLFVEIWLKNSSNVTENPTFTPLLGWMIQASNGKRYPLGMSISPGNQKLNPGDSLNWKINLIGQGINPVASPSYFPEGTYKLSYWLFGDSIPALTFTVVKPVGEEDMALDLFLKAFPPMKREEFDNLWPHGYREYYQNEVKSLIRVADRYPKSVYAAEALYGARIAAWIIDDSELAYRLNLRLLEEYSDPFRGFFNFLRLYYDKKKDPNGFRLEVQRIINSSQDAEVVARARGELQALGKNK